MRYTVDLHLLLVCSVSWTVITVTWTVMKNFLMGWERMVLVAFENPVLFSRISHKFNLAHACAVQLLLKLGKFCFSASLIAKKWRRDQRILKGEVSQYRWPPVWPVWNQLYDNWQFLFLFAKQTNPNQSNRRSTVF